MNEPRISMKPLVSIPDDVNGCWEWKGKIHKDTGYGCKTFGGKTLLAHRWLWQMLQGPIPDGLVINHLCSNTKCVNPHHLEVIDQAGNCRHGRGAKLTTEEVSAIKAARIGKTFGRATRIAERYNVSAALIHDIWNGRAWKEVAAPLFKQYRGMHYAV